MTKKKERELPTPEGDVSLAGNELVVNLLVAVAQLLKHHSDFSSSLRTTKLRVDQKVRNATFSSPSFSTLKNQPRIIQFS